MTLVRERRSSWRGRTAVGLAAGGLLVGAMAVPASAGGQLQPSASAEGVCDDEGMGGIAVSIVDNFSTTYDVVIDGELVAQDITDTDGSVVIFAPYEDGTYSVRVDWLGGETTILDVDVEVDCVPDVTTPTVPDTQPTSSSTTAPAPAARAAAATPRFTG